MIHTNEIVVQDGLRHNHQHNNDLKQKQIHDKLKVAIQLATFLLKIISV